MFGKKEKEFTFRYASGFEGKDYPARCVFSPSYFDLDPTVLDARLCRASICLALSAFGSNEADPAKNIISFLSSVGCKKIDVNPDYRLAPHPRTIGLALGQRRLGFRTTLFVLGVRGSNYQGEWGGNFLLGPSGPHQGFDLAAEKAFAFLKSRALKRSGKRVLWISGYSRAGAVANLTAAKAIDSGLFDAVCCYCFEAPAGAERSVAKDKKYRSIHNILDASDLVPLTAPSSFGFARYGTDHFMPDPMFLTEMPSEAKSIWKTLADCSGREYRFKAKKVTIGSLIGRLKDIPEDESNKDLPRSLFLRMMVPAFVSRAGTREQYVKEMQPGLVALGTLIGGLGNPYKNMIALLQSILTRALEENAKLSLLARGLRRSEKLEASLIPIIEQEIGARKWPLDKGALAKSLASVAYIMLDIALHEPWLVATMFDEENVNAILAAHSPTRVYAEVHAISSYEDEPCFSVVRFDNASLEIKDSSGKPVWPISGRPTAYRNGKKEIALALPRGDYEASLAKGKAKLVLDEAEQEIRATPYRFTVR